MKDLSEFVHLAVCLQPPCLKLGRTFHVFGDGGQKQSSAPPGDITVGNVGYGIYAKCGTFGKVIVFFS